MEAAGSVLVTDALHGKGPLPAFDAAVAEAHFERAALNLADRIARGRGEPVSKALLQREEAALLEEPPKREDDETGYWTAIIELGALAAAVMRLGVDGGWRLAGDLSTLPMTFRTVRDQQVNFFCKVMKLIENGAEDSVVSLVDAVVSMARE